MRRLFFVFVACTLCWVATARDVAGQWHGVLAVQGMKLRLVFHINNDSVGYSATLDSPDQGVTGIVASEVRVDSTKLRVEIQQLGASYEAEMKGDSLVGTFSQKGMSFPLNLTRRQASVAEMKRPQEPHPPYPYHSEDLYFENTTDGVRLAGTLTLPKTKGKFPVVVLISGSGPQDRNEALMGHKPFLVLADFLTRNGIGVLRYDDRGTAKSTGDFNSATSLHLSRDVEAAVSYLTSRKEVDKKKIGLIGHSEGGIIAPMLAANDKRVAFVVMLAGPGVRGDELLLLQNRAIAQASGAPEAAIAGNEKLNAPLFRAIVNATDTVGLRKKLMEIMRESINTIPELKASLSAEQQDDLVANTVSTLLTPWMTYFIKHDPTEALRKVKVPVLALNGSLDLQVPASENLTAINKALRDGGNTAFQTTELPGLNHLFQEAETGLPNEYPQIEQTISPRALDEILKWLKLRTRRKGEGIKTSPIFPSISECME